MFEGGEPSAPATPGLLLLSYTTPRDAAEPSRFAEPSLVKLAKTEMIQAKKKKDKLATAD
jgi:hypothetical protein